MSPLGPRAQGFYRRYVEEFPEWQRVAEVAGNFFRDRLTAEGIEVHLVSARAKSPRSVLGKIRRKGYGDPYRQLTDRVGVRVVTYYREDVDRVVGVIRPRLTVNEKLSGDKRTVLGLERFGYRSVHLVAQVQADGLPLADRPILEGKWIEVQVRSILEHAWAAIEHEVIYKSAIQHNDEVLRQFAALAGALEVLDSQFQHLRNTRTELIMTYAGIYERGEDPQAKFDVARLLAFLEARFPNGQSWRTAEAEGQRFPPGSDAACLEALAAIEVFDAQGFDQLLGNKAFLAALDETAAREGIGREEVAHLALVVLAVASVQNDMLVRDFPELAELAVVM